MEVPGIAAAALEEGEEVATSVALGGDDRLFVTPQRSLVYRSGGVLSDESVESLDHDVERLTVSEGRRKATIGLEYAVDGDRELAVPLDRLEAVLQPLLAAVLRAGDVTGPGERVHRVFSFSELTLVVTDERLLKHVGAVLWDDDHESIPFESVTDLSYEEGSVATGVVFTVDGRKERLKTPNDRLAEVREHLESALLAAHGVDSIADLGDEGDDETEADPATEDPGSAVADFGGVDALDAGPDADDRPVKTRSEDRSAGDSVRAGRDAVGAGGVTADDAGATAESEPAGASGDTATGDGRTTVEDSGGEQPAAGERAPEPETPAESEPGADPDAGDEDGTDDRQAEGADPGTPFTEPVEPAEPDGAVQEELSDLRAAVERQNELLRQHTDAIERLVETLREN